MLLILLALFAVFVGNGDANCMLDLTNKIQDCQKDLQDSMSAAASLSEGPERDRKICCGLSDFEGCAEKAAEKCDGASSAIKLAIQAAKNQVKSPCADYPSETCGAASIVPMNAGIAYFLLYLGYFLYVRMF